MPIHINTIPSNHCSRRCRSSVQAIGKWDKRHTHECHPGCDLRFGTLCTTRRKYSRLRVNVWKRGYGEIDNIGLKLSEFEQCHELPNGNTYCAGGNQTNGVEGVWWDDSQHHRSHLGIDKRVPYQSAIATNTCTIGSTAALPSLTTFSWTHREIDKSIGKAASTLPHITARVLTSCRWK